MLQLYKKALESYIKILEIHINTKTQDYILHQATEKFYETLFEVAHLIWEKYVDLWWELLNKDTVEQKNEVLEIIEDLQKEISNYAKNNEISLWTEDLLWSLANQLEEIKWTAKSL